MKQIVEIWSGARREPGFISEDGRHYWRKDELRDNGQPDKRKRGTLLGVSWICDGMWHSGSHAILDEALEVQARPIRDQIKALEAQLSEARKALVCVYAGPKPVESQNQ